MTYIKNGTEYLDWDEYRVYNAVRSLSAAGRTTNNSQLANATGLSRTKVGQITPHLRARGFIKNVGKGAAYHWRTTAKPALILERQAT